MHQLLHDIIEKLPIHHAEKAELHAKVTADEHGDKQETGETENGNG